jgi:hypothetical protein
MFPSQIVVEIELILCTLGEPFVFFFFGFGSFWWVAWLVENSTWFAFGVFFVNHLGENKQMCGHMEGGVVVKLIYT